MLTFATTTNLMSIVTIPNLLSVSRVFLAGLMFWCVIESDWYFAVSVLWIAIGTDVLDGYLARKTVSSTSLGGLLDHGSDALFVTVTIAALTQHAWAPLMLVVVIPLAFLQYMLDSRALAGQPLRSSYLGRYNGIAYYVLAGFPIMQLTLGLTVIPFEWFYWIGWGLVITTAISMMDRLVTLLSNRSLDK